MPKFARVLPAQMIEGRRARERASVTALDGRTPIECDLRILMPEDDAAVEEGAVAYARAHKVESPLPGNTQYERGLVLHTLVRACLDYEVADREEPYFESVEEVERHLDEARMLVLFFAQRSFQKRLSPNPRSDDPGEFLRLLFASIRAKEAGEDPALPFVDLPRGTLVNFALQAVTALTAPLPQRSESGSSSPGASESSTSSSQG